MNIKMPKKENKVELFIDKLKSFIVSYKAKVTTKKGKITRAIIIGIILLVLVIALSILTVSMRKSDTFNSPDNTKAKYLNEKNSGKVKEVYNATGEKEKFLVIAKYIELKVVNYYLNTTSNQKEVDKAIIDLNKEFEKREWKIIDMEKPKEWIGHWNISSDGSTKFKFLNKQMEPNWINDLDVSKYIIKN